MKQLFQENSSWVDFHMQLKKTLRKSRNDATYYFAINDLEEAIRDVVIDNDYELFQKPQKETTLLIRLSVIPFVMLLLLLFVTLPVKWILTGKRYSLHSTSKNRFNRFVYKWGCKLGLR